MDGTRRGQDSMKKHQNNNPSVHWPGDMSEGRCFLRTGK